MSLVLIKPFSRNSQSAGKLLDTGFNTVQSTLLLKKQVEVEKVQEDLDIKRQQFAERMAACKRKEEELKKKQTQVKCSNVCKNNVVPIRIKFGINAEWDLLTENKFFSELIN